MANNSNIEWTDTTWNPVTGCSRVSPGCDHCYMYSMYPRLRGMGVPGYEASPDAITLLPERLEQPFKWRKPRVVFVCSMSDLFHPAVPYEYISQVFRVMRWCTKHQFQVLTKRPGRAVGWWERNRAAFGDEWPSHIWIGTSVESQKYAPRLTVLARLPARTRFVSAEPLLGPLDLTRWLHDGSVEWVITGGESGPGARSMDLEWATDLRDQAVDAGVPFFLKQLGGASGKRGGQNATLDGRIWHQMPAEGRN